MKKFSLFALMMTMTIASFAQTWKVDGAHSRLGFKVTHNSISEFQGNFNTYEANIQQGKSGFEGATINVVIDVNSINTDNDARDNHLKSADFFNVEKNPKITFKGGAFKKTGEKTYTSAGDLTFNGVTKPMTLDIKVNGTTINERNKKEIAGLTVTGNFKRSDFGFAAGMGEAMLSDVVTLYATGEFTKE